MNDFNNFSFSQERIPPMIDDFLFICDNAYAQAELISMELEVFKTIKFDLGFPLSYRFVRRYAKVYVSLRQLHSR